MTSRRFPRPATDDILQSLGLLAAPDTLPDVYRAALRSLGKSLGERMCDSIDLKGKVVFVVSGVEDVDSLGSGLIEVLASVGADVRLACLWMFRRTLNTPEPVEVANIVQEYIDPVPNAVDHFIILKSIVSSSCTIRTSLDRMLDETDPAQIDVVAPVMLEGAPERLEAEFEDEVRKKLSYWVLAVDGVKDEAGNVIPGIGGNVYRRLGFSSQEDKNFHMPEIVAQKIMNRQAPSSRLSR